MIYFNSLIVEILFWSYGNNFHSDDNDHIFIKFPFSTSWIKKGFEKIPKALIYAIRKRLPALRRDNFLRDLFF